MASTKIIKPEDVKELHKIAGVVAAAAETDDYMKYSKSC